MWLMFTELAPPDFIPAGEHPHDYADETFNQSNAKMHHITQKLPSITWCLLHLGREALQVLCWESLTEIVGGFTAQHMTHNDLSCSPTSKHEVQVQ